MTSLLPDEDLRPTHTPYGAVPEWQAETMRRLRELENRGRQAEFDRNDLMAACALSSSLSRPDMARAIGKSRSRVDQILSQHAAMLQERKAAAQAEQVARHLA
jgi:hypothetical protein